MGLLCSHQHKNRKRAEKEANIDFAFKEVTTQPDVIIVMELEDNERKDEDDQASVDDKIMTRIFGKHSRKQKYAHERKL